MLNTNMRLFHVHGTAAGTVQAACPEYVKEDSVTGANRLVLTQHPKPACNSKTEHRCEVPGAHDANIA